MIWISTLCLLAIAAWLFFNALNERRWVDAHSHDETVASDEGILPSLTSRTASVAQYGDSKISIDQESGRFARAVQTVKEKAQPYSERFVESKIAAARISDDEQRPRSAADENTLFGRAVARVSARGAEMDKKFMSKIKSSSALNSPLSAKIAASGNMIEDAAKKVAASAEEASKSVAERAKAASAGISQHASENGTFGKVVQKVSSQITAIDKKRSMKLAETRNFSSTMSNVESSTKDLLSRVSDKVGSRVSELSAKLPKQKENSKEQQPSEE